MIEAFKADELTKPVFVHGGGAKAQSAVEHRTEIRDVYINTCCDRVCGQKENELQLLSQDEASRV